MKAVVAAFNQEKALVGAFSVITKLRMQFGWNFLKHYWKHMFGSRWMMTGWMEVEDAPQSSHNSIISTFTNISQGLGWCEEPGH